MKTSSVLASVLFGSFAVAAPFDKRALIYKTEVVTETVVVYTTIYDDELPTQATTTPGGQFHGQPASSSAVISSSSTFNSTSSSTSSVAQEPAYTPPALVPAPSSVYVAPPQAPVPTPTPAPEPTPAPAPSPSPVESPPPAPPVYTPEPAPPAPAPSSVYQAPPPAASSAAPAPAPPANGGGAGENSGDITIYEPNGGFGACGTSLSNEDFVVALSKDAWGASTYDVMTGAATNKWCNQKIQAFYQGRTVTATIMDMCPGCSGMDIDLSPAAWRQLTGSDEKTRYKATWSKVS